MIYSDKMQCSHDIVTNCNAVMIYSDKMQAVMIASDELQCSDDIQ